MICFYGYLKPPGGLKGRVNAADKKARSCVCKKTEAKCPATTITGGFLLQNHCHYGTSAHLGSSCRAAMDGHKMTSSWHSSRATFQQTAVCPAPATARPSACVPPLKATILLKPIWTRLFYLLPLCIRVGKSALSCVWLERGSKMTELLASSKQTQTRDRQTMELVSRWYSNTKWAQ